VSRTSIPIDESTKEQLDELKRDDETWDEFLERVALSEQPIKKGFLPEEGSEAVGKAIEETRESF